MSPITSLTALLVWTVAPEAQGSRARNQVDLGADHELRLRYATFDPLGAEPEVSIALCARPMAQLQVVQWLVSPTEEHRATLRALDAEVPAFFPDRSYLVRIDPNRVPQVRTLPFVRWIGAMHPAYKLEPTLLAELMHGNLRERACYDVVFVGASAEPRKRIRWLPTSPWQRGLRFSRSQPTCARERHLSAEHAA